MTNPGAHGAINDEAWEGLMDAMGSGPRVMRDALSVALGAIALHSEDLAEQAAAAGLAEILRYAEYGGAVLAYLPAPLTLSRAAIREAQDLAAADAGRSTGPASGPAGETLVDLHIALERKRQELVLADGIDDAPRFEAETNRLCREILGLEAQIRLMEGAAA